MKTLMYTIFILLMTSVAEAKTTLIIGLDLSRSSPLSNEAFAIRAGKKIALLINSLNYGDVIIFRSFGAYKNRSNAVADDFELDRNLKPRTVAIAVGQFVASVQKKNLVSEDYTNVLGFLSNQGSEHISSNSDNDKNIFILISDGIEQSSQASIPTIIKTGTGRLPNLRFNKYEGVKLEIWGLGYGLSAADAELLKEIWFNWAKAQGFSEVRLLNNW